MPRTTRKAYEAEAMKLRRCRSRTAAPLVAGAGPVGLVNRANVDILGVIKAFSLINAGNLSEDHPAQDWLQHR